MYLWILLSDFAPIIKKRNIYDWKMKLSRELANQAVSLSYHNIINFIHSILVIHNTLISSSCKPVAFEMSGVNVAISASSLSSIPFIPQNIFLLQKYNFYMKSANKSTEFLQIKIYLLLYSHFQGYALSWISDAYPYASWFEKCGLKMLLLFCYFVKVKTFWGVNDSTRSKRNVIYKYYII